MWCLLLSASYSILQSVVVNIILEVMRSATPNRGIEPFVGPKTVLMGFPRVVIECLLELAELARGGAAAIEGVNMYKVGKLYYIYIH